MKITPTLVYYELHAFLRTYLQVGDFPFLFRLDKYNFFFMFPQDMNFIVQPFLIHLMYSFQKLDLVSQRSNVFFHFDFHVDKSLRVWK